MSILTVSGRAVKRPGKLIGAGQVVTTPQIVRALRRAKCPAPWAGWGCSLTDAGLEVTENGLAATNTTEAAPCAPALPSLTWEQVCAADDDALAGFLAALESGRDAAEARGDAGAVASLLGRIDDIESEVAQRAAWRAGCADGRQGVAK